MADPNLTDAPPAPAPGGDPPPPPPPPAGDPPPADPPKDTQPPAWTDLLKGIQDEDARKFAERYTDLGALAKGGLELRKLSSQRDGWLKLPDANATDAEKAAYRKALGVPEGPEAYGVNVPEEMAKDDPDFADRLGRFLKAMHSSDASKAVVAQAVDWFISENRTIATREEEARKASMAEGEQKLRQRWGADYENYIGFYPRTVAHFGGEEVAGLLQSAGLDNHPAIVEMFVKIGRMTADSIPAIAQPRQQIASDLDALKAEASERMQKGTFNDPDFQRRWSAGFQRAFSSAA